MKYGFNEHKSKVELSEVAISGDYSHLVNVPDIEDLLSPLATKDELYKPFRDNVLGLYFAKFIFDKNDITLTANQSQKVVTLPLDSLYPNMGEYQEMGSWREWVPISISQFIYWDGDPDSGTTNYNKLYVDKEVCDIKRIFFDSGLEVVKAELVVSNVGNKPIDSSSQNIDILVNLILMNTYRVGNPIYIPYD